MPQVSFYKSTEWKAIRLKILRRDHHQCQICRASVRKKGQAFVDHKISRRRAPHLSLDPENLWTLCRRCHNQKTNAVDGGYGRKPRPEHLPSSYGAGPDGLPINPDHPWNSRGK